MKNGYYNSKNAWHCNQRINLIQNDRARHSKRCSQLNSTSSQHSDPFKKLLDLKGADLSQINKSSQPSSSKAEPSLSTVLEKPKSQPSYKAPTSNGDQPQSSRSQSQDQIDSLQNGCRESVAKSIQQLNNNGDRTYQQPLGNQNGRSGPATNSKKSKRQKNRLSHKIKVVRSQFVEQLYNDSPQELKSAQTLEQLQSAVSRLSKADRPIPLSVAAQAIACATDLSKTQHKYHQPFVEKLLTDLLLGIGPASAQPAPHNDASSIESHSVDLLILAREYLRLRSLSSENFQESSEAMQIIVHSIYDGLAQQAPRLTANQIASSLYTLQPLGFVQSEENGQIVDTLLAQFRDILKTATIDDVVKVMRACRYLRVDDLDLHRAMVSKAQSTGDMDAVAASSILTVWGHLNVCPLPAATELCSIVTSDLFSASYQASRQTLWAITTLDLQVPMEDLGALVDELVTGMDDKDHDSVTMVTWCLAKLRWTTYKNLPMLIDVLQQACLTYPYTITPNHCATLLWSLDQLSAYRAPFKLFKQLFHSVANARFQADSTYAITALAFCQYLQQAPYRSTSYVPLPQVRRIVAHFEELPGEEVTAQYSSIFLRALTRLKYFAPRSFRNIMERDAHKFKEAKSPQQIKELSYSVALFGYRNEHLDELLQYALNNPNDMGTYLLSITWCVAVSGRASEFSNWEEVGRVLSQQVHRVNFSHQRQMYTQLLLVVKENLGLQLVDDQQYAYLLDKWKHNMTDSVHVSMTQNDVFEWLRDNISNEVVSEYALDGGLLSLDVVVTDNEGKKVAIEVNGIQHYCVNIIHKELQSERYGEVLLSNRGWKLLKVHFTDWNAKRSAAERRMYFEHKFEQANVQVDWNQTFEEVVPAGLVQHSWHDRVAQSRRVGINSNITEVGGGSGQTVNSVAAVSDGEGDEEDEDDQGTRVDNNELFDLYTDEELLGECDYSMD